MKAFEQVETFIHEVRPQFILFQCGADSIAGDPIAQLRFSPECHASAASRLRRLAEKYAHGRMLVMGGGGYNLSNIATAWCAIVEALL